MKVQHISKQDFHQEVLSSDKPVLLDFWAPWCGPCRMQAPILEKFAEENPGIKVVKVNVDDNQELAMEHNISSIIINILIPRQFFRTGLQYFKRINTTVRIRTEHI